VRALQVDGGSEFAAQPASHRVVPRSLNGRAERANRAHTEEFYEVTACSLPITQLNHELQAWERTYNRIRPRRALGYLTPQQFWLKPHFKERIFSVTNLLDEYIGLPVMRCISKICTKTGWTLEYD